MKLRRFEQLCSQYILIEEKGEKPVDLNAPAEPAQAPTDLNAPTSEDKQEEPTLDNQKPPEPAISQLSPASYVTLVRLLRDAFIAKPSDEDASTIAKMKFTTDSGEESGEINETNAEDAFSKILPIISKYSRTDINLKDMLQKM